MPQRHRADPRKEETLRLLHSGAQREGRRHHAVASRTCLPSRRHGQGRALGGPVQDRGSVTHRALPCLPGDTTPLHVEALGCEGHGPFSLSSCGLLGVGAQFGRSVHGAMVKRGVWPALDTGQTGRGQGPSPAPGAPPVSLERLCTGKPGLMCQQRRAKAARPYQAGSGQSSVAGFSTGCPGVAMPVLPAVPFS